MVQEESNISVKVEHMASRLGITTFRNNVGQALVITGKSQRMALKACIDICAKMGCRASRLAYGLLKGSGDRIGWRTVTITQDMVGKQFAQFVSIEVKTKTGRASPDQLNWQSVVNRAGGVAVIVNDENKLQEELDKCDTFVV
jgi:hypothetical protein